MKPTQRLSSFFMVRYNLVAKRLEIMIITWDDEQVMRTEPSNQKSLEVDGQKKTPGFFKTKEDEVQLA